jgi:hypothetical protein
MRVVTQDALWLEALVAATNGSQIPHARIHFTEKLGADGVQNNNMQSNGSVSHRLVDEGISGSGCLWKSTTACWPQGIGGHHFSTTTGAGGRGNEDLMCGGRSKRPVQPEELGRGASGRLVLKAFLLGEVPLGASLAGLLPTNGCSRR